MQQPTATDKIKKLENARFAELDRVLTMQLNEKDRRDIIVSKVLVNLYSFIDYMQSHQAPYADFLSDIVTLDELLPQKYFSRLFLTVCALHTDQDLVVRSEMVADALEALTSKVYNVQAAFGVLRLAFQNGIAFTGFPLRLLLDF